ncbi:NAD-P-binding protein [Cubamyces sp. BRFM 1775]|nr:NAD-P-binding protein [Cubamyces sp. BRFM 1775]
MSESATNSYSVAIIGGTGGLGKHISQAFLTDFKPDFHNVRILTRDPSSATAQDLAVKGAQLRTFDESDLARSLDEALESVDVVVNVLPGKTPDEVKRAVIDAAARSRVKVYFLDEYGLDHRLAVVPGHEHPGWLEKGEVSAETRELLRGRKVIALYATLFLEFAITVLGIDLDQNTYTCYGPPTQKFSITAMEDIGRAVARLSILALDPSIASTVPDEVQIAGTTTTYEEIRNTVARVRGVPSAEIEVRDVGELKEEIRRGASGKTFYEYIKVVIGEGKVDFSADNANELVNPGEKFWRWKTVEDHVRAL